MILRGTVLKSVEAVSYPTKTVRDNFLPFTTNL